MVRGAADALTHSGIQVTDEPPPALDRGVTLYSELRDTDRLRDVRQLHTRP